jgi:riboflavin kinase/FMN adenylyltransferase
MLNIEGIVQRGEREASSRYQMPTANIVAPKEVEEGVFIGETKIESKAYPSVICIRTAPQGKIAESHVIDQSMDLYGKKIEIQVKQKIRDLIPFADHESMREAMQDDLLFARRFFSAS